MIFSKLKRYGFNSALAMAFVWTGFFNMPVVSGAGTPEKGETFKAGARGFGNVDVTLRRIGEKKDSSWTTFSAEDAEHAKICASKRMADLLGFGDLKSVAGGKLPGTVLELNGAGFWLLGLDGLKFHELFAPTMEGLTILAKECNAASWQPVPEKAYPRWLDCFDNAGPGVWIGGGGGQYDLPSDFE